MGAWKRSRYEDEIPEEIRELAEKHKLPKPNRWVPSAESVAVKIGDVRRDADGSSGSNGRNGRHGTPNDALVEEGQSSASPGAAAAS
jgi:hypothetical protein